MKQITEDYCSFEVAKLLKEKGFDGECQGYYEVPTKLSSQKNVRKQLNVLPKNWNEYNKECVVCEYISISTHQMALKWLREVHNIHIEIYRTACGYLYIISNIPYGTDLYNPEYGGDDENSGQWTTYEKAVEAAIKYTLENLI